MTSELPTTRRVLLADAEAMAIAAMRETLARTYPDAAVDVARSGAELFDRLQRKVYDVVVLDTILENVDPWKLLRVLEVARARRPIRLILLMDRLAPAWCGIGRATHAYEILVKPLRRPVLEQTFAGCFAALSPRSVLVADASPRARGLVKRILGESQFALEVTEVESGRGVLRQLRRRAFDLALVDFGLEDMPALEVATRVVARGEATAGVLMMGTGREHCRGLSIFGIGGFLEKPFCPAILDDRLHQMLGLWRPYLLKGLQPAPR
ncbi:MAG: response regulator [Salinarimonas sp.]